MSTVPPAVSEAETDAPFARLESLFARIRILPDADRARIARDLAIALAEFDERPIDPAALPFRATAQRARPSARRIPWLSIALLVGFVLAGGYLAKAAHSLGVLGQGGSWDVRKVLEAPDGPLAKVLAEASKLIRQPTSQEFRDATAARQRQLKLNEKCILYLGWSEETLNEDTPESARKEALERLFTDARERGCMQPEKTEIRPVRGGAVTGR